MFDVAIIGCGIIGAAAAYELSRYQLRVCVLEKRNDVCDATTKANSAILHAGFDPEPGTLMAKLNVQGALMAKELCKALDVPYRQTGSLVLAFNEADLATINELYRRGMQNGVPDLRILAADEVRKMEPEVSQNVVGALLAPSAAIVSPWEYGLALAEAAVRNGTELMRSTQVISISAQTDHWIIQTNNANHETIRARYILNCAGIYSDEIHNMVAAPSFRMKPSKGEYYLLDKSEGTRVQHVIFQCPNELGKGVLVAPTVHGNLIVGPNAQSIEDKEDISSTAEGLAFVCESAIRSVPSISFRDNIRNFAGIRSNTDRDDFILEKAAPRFIDLAGIKSPGLTAAPAIAVYAVELLRQEGLQTEPKEAWDGTRKLVRFAQMSPEEKNHLLSQNPSYGRVICRCETVTEGEILDALRSPIPPSSLDGVKRRTTAGSGRCQGGFCGPRILSIMAQEYQVAPESIVQDADGSYILIGETKQGGNANA